MGPKVSICVRQLAAYSGLWPHLHGFRPHLFRRRLEPANMAMPGSAAVRLECAFYNPGLNKTQVQTPRLYNRHVLSILRRDVLTMSRTMHVICLCELGPIDGSLETQLNEWMSPVPTSFGMPGSSTVPVTADSRVSKFPCVEKMLLELVENSPDWRAYAMAHYGLLIKVTDVQLVNDPVLVGLYELHPTRVAMKFQILPLTSSGGRAEATEIWNVHCPSSDNHPNYGPAARAGVWQTISSSPAATGGTVSRRVVGGDPNYSRREVDEYNQRMPPHLQFRVFEPIIARPGDIALTRDVDTELVDISIGADYIEDPRQSSSDAHNACALVLICPVEDAQKAAHAAPTTAHTVTIGGDQSKT